MNFMNSLFFDTLQNGVFAAITAIGFGSISNIPFKAFSGCALLAAIGYVVRYVLIYVANWNIIPASFIAALSIGFISIPAASIWKCPVECLSSQIGRAHV